MNFFVFSCLLAFISDFSIGIVLLIKLKGKKISSNLGWACLASSIWSFGALGFSTAPSKELALFWIKIAHIGVILTPTLFLHFILQLTNYYKKNIIIVAYSLSAFFLYLSFFKDYLFYSTKFSFDQFYFFRLDLSSNPAYLIFYIVFYWLILPYAFFLLINFFRSSIGQQRYQIKYFLVGMLIGWLGPHGMYLYVIFGLPLYPYSNILIAIYPFIFAYAIAKRQFFNIEIVIKKSLVYSILVTLITAIYLIFVIFIEKTLQSFVGYRSYIINILAIFIIAIFFSPLKNKIQIFVDKYFFKGTLSSLAEEKQRLEEELRRSDRLKAVATLAAGMAHEIKNPLTSIKTFTEYLEQNRDNPEFIAKFKKIVGSEVDKINTIVHQLLDFSKPAPLKLGKCEIHQILDETIAFLSSELLKHKITLVKELNAQNTNIQADFNQLKQAFLNILLNAIRAMPNGGTLTMETQSTADIIQISIKDTGIGIKNEDVSHVFDPFYTTFEEGTGLGLSITHGIIKEHSGRIDVESKVGVGAKFIISFPLQTD